MTTIQKRSAVEAERAAFHMLFEHRTQGRQQLLNAVSDLLAMIGRGLKGE